MARTGWPPAAISVALAAMTLNTGLSAERAMRRISCAGCAAEACAAAKCWPTKAPSLRSFSPRLMMLMRRGGEKRIGNVLEGWQPHHTRPGAHQQVGLFAAIAVK